MGKRQLRLKQRPNYKIKYDEFIKNTIPGDRFIVENVAEDNACFYRAVSNELCYNVDSPEDSSEVVLDFIGIWKTNKDYELQDTEKWGYGGSEQSRTAQIIQQLARKWIIQNRDSEIKSIPGYRVIDMLRDIHDVNFTTSDATLNASLQNDDFIVALYDSCYSNFAANSEDNSEDEDEIDDVEFHNDYICELLDKNKQINNDITYNELKQTIKDSQILNKFDRWGSSLEAYALSELFKIPIIVYTSKKFNHSTGMVELGRNSEKNIRFEIMQKWGAEYEDKAPPVELLYKAHKKTADHYMALYRKY